MPFVCACAGGFSDAVSKVATVLETAGIYVDTYMKTVLVREMPWLLVCVQSVRTSNQVDDSLLLIH